MVVNDSSSDEDLMVAYQDGNGEAFRLLYLRHSPRVYGYLLSSLKERSLADDVLQNTFFKLHRTRFQYSAEFQFEPWLFAISRNVLIDYIRKKERGNAADLEASQVTAFSELTTESEIDLDVLPEQQKAAVEMRYRDDLDFDEIARRLETSPANVRQLVSRAVKRLRTSRSRRK